jgi:hypothetical protein
VPLADEKTVDVLDGDLSYTVASNAIMRDPSLSMGARMTYWMLLSYAFQKEECWPGQARLATLIGVTEKPLRNWIAELEERGLVVSIRRGKGLTNLYRLRTTTPSERELLPVISNDVNGSIYPSRTGAAPAKELQGEEDEEDGSPNRPVVEGLDLRSERTGLPARASEGAREAQRLCDELAAAIVANGARRPNITKTWLDDARLLVDRDGIAPADVSAAIQWATSDSFWRANILSMPTLRKRYDTLRLQAQRAPAPSSTRDYDAAMESLREMAESS